MPNANPDTAIIGAGIGGLAAAACLRKAWIDASLPDPLARLTFVGALTTRLRLITGVLVLPQRNPLVLAKHLATIDHLTGGRLELGIGWLRDNFRALGIPWARRGPRTDENVHAMRALWERDDASFEGEFVSFEGVSCNLKPAQGSVPIVVGGNSEPAKRRAARLADGYFPATGDTSLDVAGAIQALRKETRATGRDPDAIEITAGCPDCLPGSGKDPLKAVADRAADGVARVVLPVNAFEADLVGMLAEFGAKVIAPSND